VTSTRTGGVLAIVFAALFGVARYGYVADDQTLGPFTGACSGSRRCRARPTASARDRKPSGTPTVRRRCNSVTGRLLVITPAMSREIRGA